MILSSVKEENKERFLSLVRKIDRDGTDIVGLISFLEESDFFDAPLTERAQRNYSGGLCEQALNRYDEMTKLLSTNEYDGISEESALIVSLFADFGRTNYFEKTSRNKKYYSPEGKKQDELGKFDWVAEVSYTLRDPSKRFIFGTLGQNSERMLSKYIPLTDEESASIIHLHASYENPNINMASIYISYPLSVFLEVADKISCFVNTKIEYLPF